MITHHTAATPNGAAYDAKARETGDIEQARLKVAFLASVSESITDGGLSDEAAMGFYLILDISEKLTAA